MLYIIYDVIFIFIINTIFSQEKLAIQLLLNNKNTNNVETHTCIILSLVFLGLFIVRCWEVIQYMLYLREYYNQRHKNIRKFNGLPFSLCFSVILI